MTKINELKTLTIGGIEYYREKEAAAYLGYTAAGLRRLRLLERAPIHTVQNKWHILYTKANLDEWLNKNMEIRNG